MDDPNWTPVPNWPKLAQEAQTCRNTPQPHFCVASHFLHHHFHIQPSTFIRKRLSRSRLPNPSMHFFNHFQDHGRSRSKHFLAQPALQGHGFWQTSKHTLSSSNESTAFLARRIFLSSRIFFPLAVVSQDNTRGQLRSPERLNWARLTPAVCHRMGSACCCQRCTAFFVVVCRVCNVVVVMYLLLCVRDVSSRLHLDSAHLNPNLWSAFLSQPRFGNFAPHLSGDNEPNFFGKVSSSPSCPGLAPVGPNQRPTSALVAFHRSGAMTTPNSKLQHPGIAMSCGTHTKSPRRPQGRRPVRAEEKDEFQHAKWAGLPLSTRIRPPPGSGGLPCSQWIPSPSRNLKYPFQRCRNRWRCCFFGSFLLLQHPASVQTSQHFCQPPRPSDGCFSLLLSQMLSASELAPFCRPLRTLTTAGTLHEFSASTALPTTFTPAGGVSCQISPRDPGLPQGCCQATRKLPVVFEEAGDARYHLDVVLTCGSSHCGRMPTTIDLSKSTVLQMDPHLPKGRPCENMTGTRCTNQVIAAPRLKSLLEHAGNARDISHGSASDCDSLIAASEVMAVGPECFCVPCTGSLTHHPFHIAETQLATFSFFTQSCWLTVRRACAPSNLGEGRNCTRKCHLHALTHLRHETHAKQNQQFE